MNSKHLDVRNMLFFVPEEDAYNDLREAVIGDVLEEFKENPYKMYPYILSKEFKLLCEEYGYDAEPFIDFAKQYIRSDEVNKPTNELLFYIMLAILKRKIEYIISTNYYRNPEIIKKYFSDIEYRRSPFYITQKDILRINSPPV